MTTPSFRDWAVMYQRAVLSVHISLYEEQRKRDLRAYILTRIERKEKALREQLARAERFIRLSDDGFPYPEVKP